MSDLLRCLRLPAAEFVRLADLALAVKSPAQAGPEAEFEPEQLCPYCGGPSKPKPASGPDWYVCPGGHHFNRKAGL